MKKNTTHLFIAIFFGWILCACNPIIGQGQSAVESTDFATLTSGVRIGQTLTARHAGLSGIEIYFHPIGPPQPGQVTLHLRESPSSSQDVQTAQLDISSLSDPGFYRFNFPPLSDSYLKDYYLVLETDSQREIRIGTAQGGTYPDGALYINDLPVDQQLAFQQVYSPSRLLLGMALQILRWIWQFMLSMAVFLLPAWALLQSLWDGWDNLDWLEKSGLAAGLGLALYPVMLLWMNKVNLPAGQGQVAGLLVVSAAIILWLKRRSNNPIRKNPFSLDFSRLNWFSASSILIVGLIFGIRFWVVRGLEYPMWGDSYQHTLMTQLILDHQGLFQSWLPYTPYATMTVQFGFPVDTAVFSWFTGMPAAQANLWIGQIINGLAIIAMYPLMSRISRQEKGHAGARWAGLAALVVTLLMPMPMGYVNWGRYAQLTGQVSVLAAIWFFWDSLETPRFDFKKALISGLAISGMLLIYYRMFFYFSAFFLSWLLVAGIPRWKLDKKSWLAFLWISLTTIILVGILIAPWIFTVSNSTLAGFVEGGLKNEPALSIIQKDYAVWADIRYYYPLPLLIITGCSVLLGLAMRKMLLPGLALWAAFLVSIRALNLINLPAANMMQSFAVLIFLYVPLALAAGWLFGLCAAWAETRSRRLGGALLFLSLAALACYGVFSNRNISQPQNFSLVFRPDQRAAEWIKTNTPSSAVFMVEGFRVYNGTSAVGGDAGWWLPYMSNRPNTMPPQYALLNEKPEVATYSKQVVDLLAVLETNPPGSPESLQKICALSVTHIYIGQGQGTIGSGASALFSRKTLVESDRFTEIYHQDRVSIFKLNDGTCP